MLFVLKNYYPSKKGLCWEKTRKKNEVTVAIALKKMLVVIMFQARTREVSTP
jgi:hypothetical protein